MDALGELLLYCRPGFEDECAQGAAAAAAACSVDGRTTFAAGSGFAMFAPASGAGAGALRELRDWRSHPFARQCLQAFALLDELPRGDRLAPIMQVLGQRGERCHDVWVEAPDSEAGKALAPFCRSFGNALVGALRKARLLDPSAPARLHAFFPQSNKVYLCSVDPALAAPWPQGIPRLKFPRQAPSRSTLKLEEAFLVLLDEGERARWLGPGMSAVDLGAAPGGWTWQLVRRSMRVTAVDNGPMDAALMRSGLVTHRREDGFRFQPQKSVDWLVCDMVEQPRRVAELVARWIAQGWCRRAIFNLKLPMKKRYEETMLCLDLLRRRIGAEADLRAKQLYHDREEITLFCAAPQSRSNGAREGGGRKRRANEDRHARQPGRGSQSERRLGWPMRSRACTAEMTLGFAALGPACQPSPTRAAECATAAWPGLNKVKPGMQPE